MVSHWHSVVSHVPLKKLIYLEVSRAVQTVHLCRKMCGHYFLQFYRMRETNLASINI